MLTVVCLKWNHAGGTKIPSQKMTRYTPDYVIRLRNMVARHYPKPHRFVCITDDPRGLEDVETIPLWFQHLKLGGCFHRLRLFSDEMRELLGPRFIAMDLDCVVTGDLTPLFHRTEPFVINAYATAERDQKYNGGLMLMDAGARENVWTRFDPIESPRAIAHHSRTVIGTDQAWIRLVLGNGEARFTEADGVYDYKHSKAMKRGLPKDARIVFFSGPRSPETEMEKQAWIRQNWQ